MRDRSTDHPPAWWFISVAVAFVGLFYFLQILENPVSRFFLSIPVDLPN